MNLLQYIHLFSLQVYAFMVGYVLYKDPKSLLSKTGAILISSFAIWNLVDVFGIRQDNSANTAMLFQNISSLGWIGFASVLLCFSLVFSKREKMLKKNGFLILIFIVPIILIYKQWSNDITGHPFHGKYGWEFIWEDTIWSYLFYTYYSLFTLLSIFIVFQHGIKTKSTREKNQSRIIVTTVLISLIGGTITDVILPFFHIQGIPQLGNVIILVFAGGILYAIVRYSFLAVTPALAAENIISTMTELLIISDQSGNIIDLNNAVLKILKYEQNELSGKSVEILFCQDNYKESLVDRMAHGEIIKNFENCFLASDRTKIPVILSCSPLKDGEGGVRGIVFVARDITERKQTEESLRQSKRELSTLMDNLPGMVYSCLNDQDWTMKFVSEGSFDLTGYLPDELTDNKIISYEEIIHPYDREMVSVTIRDALEKKDAFTLEYRIVTKFGTVKYVWERGQGVYISNDTLHHLEGFITDITEHKRAEAEQARLLYIMESSLNEIYVFDSITLIFDYVNQGALRNLGYTREAMRGMTPLDLKPEFTEASFRQTITPLLRHEQEQLLFNTVHRRADGSLYPVEIHLQLVELEGQRVFLAVILDITERKRAEEALRKSEAHFKTIFNEAPLGIALIDSITGHVYTVNPMFSKIMDRTLDEMINIDWMSITHPDDVQEDLDNMALMNAGKISGFQMEKRYLHHDGTPVWINMTIAPIYVEDKTHPRHLCMIEDITERKQEEQALRRSEAIQAKMVANIGDVIVIIDQNGINRYKSPNIEKWFGWSPEEVVGISTWENVHPEDVDSLKILFDTLVGKPNATGTTEIRYRCKDGNFKWIEFTAVNLLDDLDIRGLLGNYHDITERKHTEETLRLSEERYRFSLEITGQIGWSIPPDGLVEDMPLWRQYSGQSIEEVKGWKWLDSIHPDDREHTHKLWIKAIAQKCKYETEYRIRRADGVYRYFMVRGIPLFNANGSVKEWVGTCIDITKRKHAEEALLKLSSAVEQTVDSIMITDRNGTIEYVNHAFEILTGYTSEEAVGKTPRILKSGTKDHNYYEELWKTILSGQVFRKEVVNKKKNGDLYDEEKTITPIFDKNKTITHFVGTGVDITERKKLELEKELDLQVQEALNKILSLSVENISLEESLERILMTIISLPFLSLEKKGGILLTEEGQNILTLKTSYNLSKEIQTKCAQVPFGDCLCGRAAATRQIQFVDCIDERHEISYEGIKQHGHYNVPILTSDNVLGVIVVYLAEYHKQEKYEQDFLLAVAVILSGLIQSKRAKIELIGAKDKAEESDRLKSAFLANMSHEVRTPLNSIIGFSELLADPFFEEEQKSEFIQSIITSGKNLLTIISDIMDISKMESGEIKIRKSQINAQKFISTVREEFTIQTEEKKLELKLNHPDNDDETVIYADAERLRQIFNNLLSNAIKFTMIGSIEIGYQPKGTIVEFFVRDTGIGIPAEYHDKIFDRFRQVEDSKTRTYGGNGLGLAISKNLVELMGGKIWLVSEPGKGSVFYFTLPAYSGGL